MTITNHQRSASLTSVHTIECSCLELMSLELIVAGCPIIISHSMQPKILGTPPGGARIVSLIFIGVGVLPSLTRVLSDLLC